MALAFAFLLSWPKFLVQGTYDFVATFPLLLLALAEVPESLFLRTERDPRHVVTPLLLVVGISMIFSPVSDEVLLVGSLLVLCLGCLASTKVRDSFKYRLLGWAGVVVAALAGALPSICILILYPPSRLVSGSRPVILTPGDVGAILNPFVFGSGNIWVSPIFWLHVEFDIALIAGIALLLLGPQIKLLSEEEVRTVLTGILPGILGGGLMVIVANYGRVGPVAYLVNLSESALIFTTAEGLVVGMVLSCLLRDISQLHRWQGFRLHQIDRSFVSTLCVSIVLLGATAIPLVNGFQVAPAIMRGEAETVSNVSSGDMAAMAFLATQPSGPVLVAPGSAAQFLPAYAPDPLIFPLTGIGGAIGFLAGNVGGPVAVPFEGPATNTIYQSVVLQLIEGNLSARFPQQLTTLSVRYIFVTGESSILFPSFQAGPLLSDPSQYKLLFTQQDAYVFGFEGVSSLS
jgi:hypothetical protein